jgi:Cu(I)/Ag(I) efflux system membrane fusion protein
MRASFIAIAILAGSAVIHYGLRHPADPPSASAIRARYFCPMHPSVVRDAPGTCPICNMELRPAEDDPAADPVPGHASFILTAQRQQLIGVSKQKAQRRPLERWVRATGQITYDPDLVAAIEEYRQAVAGGANAIRGGPEGQRLRLSLQQSIGARLKLLGLTEEQIEEIAGRTGPPAELLVGPGSKRVWVFIDVFASDLGAVGPGQALEARTDAVPGRVFRGVIKAVDRAVNPLTHTARARALVRNTEGLLRPNLHLDVRIRIPLGVRLAVPAEAVLETGEKEFAFVVHEDGAIEPRLVTVGGRGEDYVGVIAGLAEGETVITSANFLIDSESRLRSALAAFRSAP